MRLWRSPWEGMQDFEMSHTFQLNPPLPALHSLDSVDCKEKDKEKHKEFFLAQWGACKFCKRWGPYGCPCHSCSDKSNCRQMWCNEDDGEDPEHNFGWCSQWNLRGHADKVDNPSWHGKSHKICQNTHLSPCALCVEGHVQSQITPFLHTHCHLKSCRTSVACVQCQGEQTIMRKVWCTGAN